MKNLSVDYSMSLEFSDSVTDHSFLLRCIPTARGCQTVFSRSLEVSPGVPLSTYRDVFGNMVYRGQCYAPHDSFSFRAAAAVQVHAERGTREPCPAFYRYGTPLTRCSDEMREFLDSSFAGTPLAEKIGRGKFDRGEIREFAERLTEAVHSRIEYKSGSTDVRTTAEAAFTLRKGVCQDYAHLFVSLCRSAGVASRYVCGMSRGEGATHAWAEFFVPDSPAVPRDGQAAQGTWFGTDPTRNKFTDDEYVILAVGRDFSDCQVDRGVFCGSVRQTQRVLVRTSETDPPAPVGEYSGHSVIFGADMAGQQ